MKRLALLFLSCFVYFSNAFSERLASSYTILGLEWFKGLEEALLITPPLRLFDEDLALVLAREANTLHAEVIHKAMITLNCINHYQLRYAPVLTVIDYSLPSSEKRLWVFDLQEKRLLFHTYVSHGIKSGTLLTRFFSNKYNSKASSMGLFRTEQAYYGREGLSLRLEGLEKGLNDNALNRYIVMHGGWYVNESFIKKYGRAGRSWGCPALPLALSSSIINTIKNSSIFIGYYPSDAWFLKSKFLNCEALINEKNTSQDLAISPLEFPREPVLFVDLNKKPGYSESKPLLAMKAADYQSLYNKAPPLERMLRRQIGEDEYIALSETELDAGIHQQFERVASSLVFVIPHVKIHRGYAETEMKLLQLGRVTILEKDPTLGVHQYRLSFENKPLIPIKTTNQFIRWLGL